MDKSSEVVTSMESGNKKVEKNDQEEEEEEKKTCLVLSRVTRMHKNDRPLKIRL